MFKELAVHGERRSPDISENESLLDWMGLLPLNGILGQQTGKSSLLPLSMKSGQAKGRAGKKDT